MKSTDGIWAGGGKGFAYNYWIDFEGIVWECRGLNAGGGLFDPLNDTVFSVGFQGDYDKTEKMPEAQFKAGYEIIRYLQKIVPTIKLVAGHRYWENKSCPGKYFPLEEMIEMANKKPEIKDLDDAAEWAKDAVQNVVESGIMVGNDQWLFKPKDTITRQEVAVVVSRLLQKIELLQKTNS